MADTIDRFPADPEQTQYDTWIKELFSDKDVLAKLLQLVIPEFAGCTAEQIRNMIEGDVLTNIRVEPGLTNTAERDQTGKKIVGLNTENTAPNEGAIYFDILFYTRSGADRRKWIINIEPMRQLSSRYRLGSRKQIYAARGLGSQMEREFKGDSYDDAKRFTSIWICLNRPVNSFRVSEMTEHAVYAKDATDKQIRSENKMLGLGESLTRICTIGVKPDQKDNEGKYAELYRFLDALTSLTMSRDHKMEILENDFGFGDLDDSKHVLGRLKQMATVMEVAREFWQDEILKRDEKLQEKDEKLQEKDQTIEKRDATIEKMGAELNEKDQTIEAMQSQLLQSADRIAALEQRIAELE